MLEEFGIDKELEELSKEVEKEIKEQFKKIDNICEKNSLKVLKAFQECNLQEMHLNSSTGYGIDEAGRNKIEEIYAKIFKSEDALVRAQFISGTHALAITLSALLRPNDTMISITGAPYDTLQTVIGCGNEQSNSSLKAFGIKYEQIELIDDDFDIKSIQERLKGNDVKLVEIQRSRGYSTRKSLTIEKIEKVIKAIREVNKDVIIMIDNCYGEFVQDREPIEVGADIAVGSLMKNLGAGIATSGAYIVGKKDLIELCYSLPNKELEEVLNLIEKDLKREEIKTVLDIVEYGTKNKFDISKIPDIYDNIKYDIIHNKSIIGDTAIELYKIILDNPNHLEYRQFNIYYKNRRYYE